MVIRNIGPRTETEVWEIGAETGVEYPKKLGIDITDGVAENIEDVAATTSCLFFAKRCHLMAKDMHAPRPQLRKGRS